MNSKRILKIGEKISQKSYLQTLNGIFKLTPAEIEVLALLIQSDRLVPCSKKARRIVKEEMKFSSSVVVSNYIKVLKAKQAIIQTIDGYKFHPMLIPPIDQHSIEIIWEQ